MDFSTVGLISCFDFLIIILIKLLKDNLFVIHRELVFLNQNTFTKNIDLPKQKIVNWKCEQFYVYLIGTCLFRNKKKNFSGFLKNYLDITCFIIAVIDIKK